jgi:hypothetical protein
MIFKPDIFFFNNLNISKSNFLCSNQVFLDYINAQSEDKILIRIISITEKKEEIIFSYSDC